MSSSDFDNFSEFKKKYNELILIIQEVSGKSELKNYIENVSDEDLKLLIDKFCTNIETDKKLKKFFLNRNERLFSERNNIKIVPSINLKTFLVNCERKNYIWECIQLLYAIYRSGNESKKDFISKIVNKIEECNYSGNISKEITNTDASSPTKNNTGKLDNMIMDIADTLRNNLVSDSKSNTKVNPIENMVKTSQMISQKYGKDLKNGNVSMNDMFDSLGRVMGEIDKKTADDEELKKVDVSEMPKPDELFKNLGLGKMGKDGEPNPLDLLSSLMGGEKKNDKDLTPEQMKEMEEFYSNMNSADINVNKNNDKKDEPQINLSSILKTLGNNDDDVIDITNDNEDFINENKQNSDKTLNIGNMLNDINSNKDGDINSRLDNINKRLISQLPEEKQQEIESLTQNVLKIMGSN